MEHHFPINGTIVEIYKYQVVALLLGLYLFTKQYSLDTMMEFNSLVQDIKQVKIEVQNFGAVKQTPSIFLQVK